MPIDLIGKVHRTVVVDGCDQLYHEDCALMFAKRCGGSVEAWESVSVPKEDPKERTRRIRRAKNKLAREQQERKLEQQKITSSIEEPSSIATTSVTSVVVPTTTSSTSSTVVVPEELEEIEMVHRIFIVFKSSEAAQVAVGMDGMSFARSTDRLSVWVANDTTLDGRPRLTTSNTHGHVLQKNETLNGYVDEQLLQQQSAGSDLLRLVGFKSMRDSTDKEKDGGGGGLLMIGGPSSAVALPKTNKNRPIDTEEQLEIIRKRKELLAALGGNLSSFRPDITAEGEEEEITPESHTKTRVPNSMTLEDKGQFLVHHFVRQCNALTRLTDERASALVDEVAVWEKRVAEGEKSYK